MNTEEQNKKAEDELNEMFDGAEDKEQFLMDLIDEAYSEE